MKSCGCWRYLQLADPAKIGGETTHLRSLTKKVAHCAHSCKAFLNADAMALPRKQCFWKAPICCFVGNEDMTSNTGPLLRFWAHKQFARVVFARRKIFDAEQFKLVVWRYVSAALEEVPRMFHLWACKQVMGIAATYGLQAK
jgi:hypothetical protein